jgi:N-acyl-D-aspartate/D-glutamate deacylase
LKNKIRGSGMPYQYDVVLKNGTVVDPVNERKGVLDVAIANGKVAEVAPGINFSHAQEWFAVRDF